MVPIEVIQSVRTGSIPGVTVLDDDPETWVFGKTEHLPFNARYRQP